MGTPWNLVRSNRIVIEISKETDVDRRWSKSPRGKPQEWTETIITGTYKLKSGIDKLEVERSYGDQFFTPTPNAGNDGYKLKEFLAKNNEGLGMVVNWFFNPILTPN